MEKRYKISEVVKELGICRKTLTNWEKKGKIPKAKREPMSRFRYWTDQDLQELKRISER